MVAIFGRLQRLGLLGPVRSLLRLRLRLDHDRLCDVRVRVRVGIRVGVRGGVRVGIRVRAGVRVGLRVGVRVGIRVGLRVGLRVGVGVGIGVRVRVGVSLLTCATASTRSVKRVVPVAASGGVAKSSVLSSSSLALAAGSEDRNQPGQG